MAENKKIEVSLPLSLYMDTEFEAQPKNTYRFCLNGVHDSDQGSKGSIVNEPGTDLSVDLPGDIMGIIPMNSDEQAILTNDGSISIFNTESLTLTSTVSALTDLNMVYPITGEFRVVRGCERVIYWRDSNNPDRYFNFDRPEKFQDSSGNFLASLFSLNYRPTHPRITAEISSRGGQLDLGTYFFAIEYLDDFENVLFTSPPTVDYIAITDDEDGGLNIDTNLAEAGGVPLSNKSVEIFVENVPDEISLLRLNVIRAITSDGVTMEAHSVNVPIIVTQNTARFTYSGYDPSRGDELVDYRQLIARRVVYDSSDSMTQVQGRLVRGGLKETVKDFSAFQRAASKICTKYVCVDVEKDDAHNHKTELGAEVRAYGIVYVFDDGTITDEFHIPGPAPVDGSDQETTTQQCLEIYVSDEGDDICPNGIRWEVEYTLDGIPHFDTGIQGTSEQVTSVVCANPSSTLTVTSFVVTNLGTDTGEFACDWEVAYRIIDREVPQGSWQLTSTAVQDTTPIAGYASSGTPGYFTSGQLYETPPNYDECNSLDYWGVDCDDNALAGTPVRYHVMPGRNLEPLITSDDKVRIIGVEFTNIDYPHPNIVDHYFVAAIRTPFTSIIETKGLLTPYNYSDNDDDTNLYTEGRYLHNVVGDAPTTRLVDGSQLHNFLTGEYLFLDRVPQGDVVVEEGYYSENVTEPTDSNNNYFDSDLPYDDLDLYQKRHEITTFNQSSQDIYNLDFSYNISRRSDIETIRNLSYSSRFNVLGVNGLTETSRYLRYVAMKRSSAIFQNVFSIRYRRISEYPKHNSIFNGDAFVSPFSVTNLSWIRVGNNGVFDLVFSEFFGLGGGDTLVRVEFEYIKDIFIESVVNPKLRHSGTDICNQYYNDSADVFGYIKRRISEKTGTDQRYKLRDSLCGEWYGYNEDYSKAQDLEQYTPLPYTWDYCSSCTGLYPNTLTWSEKSFLDDRADNYRVYLPNNLKTITGNKGVITAMDYKDDKIVLRTERSCFFLRPNPQQLQTSDDVIYIGTGDFLSLDPQEINVVDQGWGGQLDAQESANTDYGLVWADRSRGKIFLLGGGMDIISNRGMYHYLKQNLKTGLTPVTLTYDPEFERLVVTKKGQFTLSYDMIKKMWVSFHSYKPTFYTYGTSTFFSEWQQKLWRHKGTVFHKFYDVAYPFIIEYIVNEFTSFHPDSVYYYVKMLKWDEEIARYVIDQDVDFDRVMIYNKNQSTGIETLTLSVNGTESVFYTAGENTVTRTDDLSKISRLMDKSTSDRILIGAPLTTQGFEDVIPLDVDANMAQGEQGYFNGKFLAVRLYLDKNNHKCIVNVVATLKHYQNR